MTSDAIHALGGVGLFLLGMIWLSEGLRGLAGQSLREALARFTKTPLTGALTGAAGTAVIQSSSATIVTAIGFVSAGLLSFPQALGVIFGANLGTTVTGWLVTIFGFKLDLGQITLPLLFLSALARIFGTNRLATIGTALAGFSLIFLGIDVLKSALNGIQGLVTPADFPDDTIPGRIKLLLIGMAITLVTQSSSAGVTAALAALGAQAINLPQAAAMVIGMDVGTTFTALLATLGGSTATRRTGLSHVIYNLMTGLAAFLLLGPYTRLVAGLDTQFALVAFHSAFNALGVIAILPFARPFARLIVAVVPDRGPRLTRALERVTLRDTLAATHAAAVTLESIAAAQAGFLERRLGKTHGSRQDSTELRAITDAIAELRRFIADIPLDPANATRIAPAERIATMHHALDHLGRLAYRCAQTHRLDVMESDARLRKVRNLLRRVAASTLHARDPSHAELRLNRLRHVLRDERERYRHRLLSNIPQTHRGAEDCIARIDAMRWLHRVSYHLWRIQHHLNRLHEAQPCTEPRPPSPPVTPPSPSGRPVPEPLGG